MLPLGSTRVDSAGPRPLQSLRVWSMRFCRLLAWLVLGRLQAFSILDWNWFVSEKKLQILPLHQQFGQIVGDVCGVIHVADAGHGNAIDALRFGVRRQE